MGLTYQRNYLHEVNCNIHLHTNKRFHQLNYQPYLYLYTDVLSICR
nr:MAG TPA: hypothetical protein [Caudoviricetes sp.]